MCGSGSPPMQAWMQKTAAPHIPKEKWKHFRWLKDAASKESTPPIQHSAPSSSGGPTSLGIRRGSGSTRRQDVASSRRTSKSKRFSTTR